MPIWRPSRADGSISINEWRRSNSRWFGAKHVVAAPARPLAAGNCRSVTGNGTRKKQSLRQVRQDRVVDNAHAFVARNFDRVQAFVPEAFGKLDGLPDIPERARLDVHVARRIGEPCLDAVVQF